MLSTRSIQKASPVLTNHTNQVYSPSRSATAVLGGSFIPAASASGLSYPSKRASRFTGNGRVTIMFADSKNTRLCVPAITALVSYRALQYASVYKSSERCHRLSPLMYPCSIFVRCHLTGQKLLVDKHLTIASSTITT